MPLTSADDIRDLLTETRTIAMVGASDRPDRDSNHVMAFLQGRGYRVIPVNPALAGKLLHGETVRAGDTTVALTWSGLGKPFCFALTPAGSATGAHIMPSLFVGCETASVTVNGQARPGAPVPREIAGQRISTAMLAFSETWIRA